MSTSDTSEERPAKPLTSFFLLSSSPAATAPPSDKSDPPFGFAATFTFSCR